MAAEFLKQRIVAGIIAGILIPIGLYTKSYGGIGHIWVHDSLGGVLYVVFWCLVAFVFFPHPRNNLKIVLSVLIITSIIEFTQLSHHPFLQYVRSYRLGQYLIGTTFVLSDFAYYVVGAVIGLITLKMIGRFRTNLPVKNSATSQ